MTQHQARLYRRQKREQRTTLEGFATILITMIALFIATSTVLNIIEITKHNLCR